MEKSVIKLRFPNFDSTAVRFYGVSADATSSSRVKNWKNPVGGYLHAMHWSDWGDFHYRITGKDDEGICQWKEVGRITGNQV